MVCVSVNDAFVMDKWGESAGATGKVLHVQQYIMLPISTDQNVGRY